MGKRLVCRVVEIPENGLKECELEGGLKLVVANSGGEFFGFQAICPHQEVPLCEGLFDGSVLTCHMHLWQWDVRTGAPLGIAEAPLQRYPVTVEGDSLYLGGDDSALGMGELFNGLDQSILEKLAALARRESHEAGAVLYRPGDQAEDFFVLESGRVEFLIGRGERTAPGGFMLKKGEVFGWAALLDGYPARIASARCLEESALLRINGKAALRVLEGDPAAGLTVMRRLAALIARYLASSGAK
ncbi:MAG: cyclic nucleotide-binding domain-containing protein [Betaproteobacteria bacterium]|nr:MAG: cyclic nucleotide-binding domain-containing protein [Betaproteobacteria bacterium]TMI11241.1 MAG: cyclic nucleotide-binding domain-containing protein [Betaproteobacteria bacterium]